MSEGPETDLSGRWHGFYNYPDGGTPNSFEAELVESAGSLTGSISEIADFGECIGQPLIAVIDGRREGHSVSFLKMYEASTEDYDVVRYDGALDVEGNEIAGSWTIPGEWSGTFLMVRNGGAEETMASEASENV